MIQGLVLLIGVVFALSAARAHGSGSDVSVSTAVQSDQTAELVAAAPRQSALLQGGLLSLGTARLQDATQPAVQPVAASRPVDQTTDSTPNQQSTVSVAQVNATQSSATTAAEQQPVVRANSVPKVRPLFSTYTVQSGDTLQQVSVRTGIAPDYLKANNPLITDTDKLIIGQQVRIPMANGLIHDIHTGETLLDIADRYGSTLQAILAANEISDPNAISIRAQIFVPHAKIAKPEPAAQTGPPPAQTSQVNAPVALSIDAPVVTATPRAASVSQAASASSSSSGGSTSTSSSAATTRSSGTGLIWPISGSLSSFYGPSHPLGIDIDLFNRGGAPIGAAGSGTVTFAGGDPCCSYGLYVDIDHGNGLRTRYAHLSRISVSRGQSVSAGQTIGSAGNTGYSTGTHLHFEVQRNGATVNPLSYLP